MKRFFILVISALIPIGILAGVVGLLWLATFAPGLVAVILFLGVWAMFYNLVRITWFER